MQFVLQATDRLVTRDQAAFDELANKNILCCARNALVSFAYTGFAYLGDIPTDQWVVEQLIGKPLPRGRDGRIPVVMGGHITSLDIGRSLKILEEKLNAAASTAVPQKWQRQWHADPFDLCVAGWQWRRNTFRPIIASLSKPENSTTFELVYSDRYWFCEREPFADGPRTTFKTRTFAAPRSNISRLELQSLVDRLQDQDADRSEAILAETIRDISTRVPQVGPHSMNILITPPSVGRARVRYVPAGGPPQAAARTSSGHVFVAPVAFSPWLVGSGMICPPSIQSGISEVRLGPYTVVLEAPASSGTGLIAMMSSQQRPPRP
jgi:hypothetical protein